jgi:hypothetical protein
MHTERRAGSERFECARLHARGFLPTDALTNASLLPGVGMHYLDTGVATQCLAAQLGTEYVRFGRKETLKIPRFARAPRASSIS